MVLLVRKQNKQKMNPTEYTFLEMILRFPCHPLSNIKKKNVWDQSQFQFHPLPCSICYSTDKVNVKAYFNKR